MGRTTWWWLYLTNLCLDKADMLAEGCLAERMSNLDATDKIKSQWSISTFSVWTVWGYRTISSQVSGSPSWAKPPLSCCSAKRTLTHQNWWQQFLAGCTQHEKGTGEAGGSWNNCRNIQALTQWQVQLCRAAPGCRWQVLYPQHLLPICHLTLTPILTHTTSFGRWTVQHDLLAGGEEVPQAVLTDAVGVGSSKGWILRAGVSKLCVKETVGTMRGVGMKCHTINPILYSGGTCASSKEFKMNGRQ